MHYINPALYHNKYRLKSCRLKAWDYGRNDWYFVTICSEAPPTELAASLYTVRGKNMRRCLGEIKHGEMHLSIIGKIIKQILLTIPQHHHVKLDYWIIMPNHIHVIIIINNHGCRDVARYVSTTTENKNIAVSKISPKPQSLSAIIRAYKSTCTKIINRIYPQINFQ